MADRVVLVGIDGLEWSLVRKGVASGRLPVLGALLARGAHAEVAVLDSVPGLHAIEQGMVSPALWTTIATGQYYFQHGIHDFRNTIECPEQPRLFESRDVRSPRLWDVLTEYGRRSLVVGYYVTHPAYTINGIMVGDMWGEIAAPNAVWPPEEADNLRHLLEQTGPAAQRDPATVQDPPPGQDQDAFREALALFTGIGEDEAKSIALRPADDWHRRLLEYRLVYPWLRDRRFHQAFCHLARSQTWDFATVYYRLIDFVSHGFWQGAGAPPGCRPDACADTIDASYRWIDDRVGEVLQILDPRDRLLIVSDHGFAARQGEPEPAAADDPTAATHGQHADPALLIVSGGNRSGAVEEMTLLDIAPTILDFFGIPQAQSLDGGPVPGLLCPAAPQSRPPVQAYAPASNLAAAGLTPEQEQVVLARLAALGYIEQ